MSNEEKKHKGLDRYLLLGLVILVMTAVMIYNLASIQIIHGKEHVEESISRISTNGYIYPKRGDIFDRNGIPIAGSRLGYCVQYVDVKMADADKNAMLFNLIKLFDETGVKAKTSKLTNYIDINPIRFKTDNLSSFIQTIIVSKDDARFIITADQAFRYMRDKTFKIDPSYSDADAYRIMQMRYDILVNQPSIQNPYNIADDVPITAVAQLEERHDEFGGVTTFQKPYRVYYNPQLISQILGYVGPISSSQYDSYSQKYPDKYYTNSDIVGRDGIEKAEENLLRAVSGKVSKEVDESGRMTSFSILRQPVPGNDLYLTIDLNLQKVALDSLIRNIDVIKNSNTKNNFHDANAGAVVVLDVNSGEVLAMASYPDYDPSVFLGNDEKAKAAILTDNVKKPMINRSTQEIYAPGSTYKPVVATASLESGTIGSNTLIDCPYKKDIGNWILTNLEGNQGKIALTKALATSSNMFFYQVGIMTGIDQIVKWAQEFGLGQKTGIEVNEVEGIIASKEYKKDVVGESWYPANTAMASIGQLYNRFTPLQIANYISTIANGGKRYTPHLVKMALSPDGKIVDEGPKDYYQMPVQQSTINAVKAGMLAVTNANDGTAFETFKDFPFGVAGKTGTSETGFDATSSSNGLFVCYAPADKPEIAVAVVVEHGVWGYLAAPIAKDIIAAYFRLNADGGNTAKEAVNIIW